MSAYHLLCHLEHLAVPEERERKRGEEEEQGEEEGERQEGKEDRRKKELKN